MELPGEQFVGDLRAEIGAVHMLTCGLAFAASDKVDMQSDASPDKQREMLTVPMRFTTTVDGQVRRRDWSSGAVVTDMRGRKTNDDDLRAHRRDALVTRSSHMRVTTMSA